MFHDWSRVASYDPKQAEILSDDPLFVRAAARAMAVMSVFEHTNKPLSLNEIAELSGLDRSAAQRMVHTLQSLDMIVRDDSDRGYLPGKRVLSMAYSYLRLNPVMQRATPILLELRRRARERVDLSLWDDTRLIYALRMPSKNEVFTATLVGNSVPVYCTAGGVAVLSRLSDVQIADIFERSPRVPYTPETFTTLDEVMGAVHEARLNGHAMMTGQLLRHEISMAVPILDVDGRPVGALHLAGSREEHDRESFAAQFAALLDAAGRGISGVA